MDDDVDEDESCSRAAESNSGGTSNKPTGKSYSGGHAHDLRRNSARTKVGITTK